MKINKNNPLSYLEPYNLINLYMEIKENYLEFTEKDVYKKLVIMTKLRKKDYTFISKGYWYKTRMSKGVA